MLRVRLASFWALGLQYLEFGSLGYGLGFWGFRGLLQ